MVRIASLAFNTVRNFFGSDNHLAIKVKSPNHSDFLIILPKGEIFSLVKKKLPKKLKNLYDFIFSKHNFKLSLEK